MPPETSRKPIESVSFPTGGDHSLRLTVAFHVAHTAPLLHPPRKLYWTYSIAHIEGKSDVLTGVLEKYQTSHEVIVGQQTLESLYSKPAEFVLWQVVRNPDYKPLKKLDDAALAVTKDAAATGNAKPKKGKKEPTKELIVRARPRSASDPDLKASFTMDPIMGLQRQHSQSPPLCQGVSQWDAPLSLIKPHPHHFDHPEKHVPLHTFGRSMSSLSDVSIARSKTPPSPHHFDKPLATVVKNGVVKQKKPLALANSSLKGFGALGRNVVVPIDKSLRISIANEFVSSRPGTGKSDDRRIRWDQEEHVGVRNRHWNARQHQLERLANDQTMDRPKPLFDKRRLETIHVPVTKVGLDLSSFFMDNCTASCVVKGVVDGHECDITVSIDELLLSTMQQEALKPFLVTLSTLSQMPVGRDDHAALKLRFELARYEYTTVVRGKREARMVIGAQHIVLGGLVTNNELIELTRGTLKVQVHDRLYMFDAADSKNVRLGQDGVLAKHLNPQRPFGHALFDMALLNENGGKLKAALVDMPMRGSIQGRTAFAESATTLSVHFSHMFNIRQEPADADRLVNSADAYKVHTAILRANARAVGLDNTSQFLADYNGTSNDATSDPGSGTSNDTTINETPDSAAANSLLAAEGETAWLQTQLASTVMPSSTDPIVSGYHMFDTAIRVYFVETTAKTLRKLQADTKGVHCVGLGSSMERVRMPFALVPKSLRIPDLKQLLLLPGVVRSSLFGFLQDLLLLGDTLKLDTPKWPVCEFPRAETVSSLCDGIATTCEFTDSLVRQVGVFQMRPAAPLAPADTQEAQPVLVKETKKQIKTDSDNRKWFNDRAAALRKDKRFVEWNRRKFYKEPYVQQYYATYNQNVYNYSIHKQSQVENH